MEEIIFSIKSLFASYGIKTGVIVLLTIAIVQIIKKPIVKRAEKFSRSSGLDKAVITKYLSLLTLACTFVINFLWSLIEFQFNFAMVDYANLVATSFVMTSIAIATFESLKKYAESYLCKKSSKGNDAGAKELQVGDKASNNDAGEVKYL